ncbi:hypothetical protein WA026_008714 [Henosepilachna vigintioctopunctata]|uniref:Uncharacterized protein n=1 Tax=Henosepilachna vigintioctopunctata TaxID=420089 RepID=A0AAW1VC21_9CUCU
MKILGLFSIFFILGVSTRDLRTVTNTTCLEECQCRNSSDALEIERCYRPINVTSSFHLLSSLSCRTIRFNQVTVDNFEDNAFNSLTQLEHVEFNDSKIINMHSQAFLRDELSSLSFTHCEFVIPPNIQSVDLEELAIKHSKLQVIPKFEDLPSLSILHLDGNKIKTIQDDTFSALDSLEEVYLGHNQISAISPKLFINNTQLSILDLSNNLLSHFGLEGTTNLEVLSLAKNQLEEFDAASSKDMSSLMSLDLSHNKITRINQKAFVKMPGLEMVNLSYNELTVLDNDTFAYNSALEKLILDGNNFKTLPIFKSHTDIFRIYNFSCKKCGIVSLSSFTFGSMPGLVEISLADNNLRLLDPKAFTLVHSLKILDLSGNKLTKLGSTVFEDNKNLNELNLSGNPLKTLYPEDFIYLKNLRKLDASNAGLKSLWADNYGYSLTGLEQLTISNNSIEDITTDDLKVMPNLKLIDLENNRIQCSIHLANLIKWLTIHEVYSSDSAAFVRTNEKLLDNAAQYFEDTYDHKHHWQKLAIRACVPSDDESKNTHNDRIMNLILQNAREIDSVPKVNPPQEVPHIDNDDSFTDIDDAADDLDEDMDEVDEEIRKFSLDQTTYIISVTSVFIITALIVLSAAVSITLMILKKHNTLNINNGNIPRIKIPRWETISHKKHSGSVYRPLSEEILAPPTPKIERYEFKTPRVHNYHT